jgi:hypothetical protein
MTDNVTASAFNVNNDGKIHRWYLARCKWQKSFPQRKWSAPQKGLERTLESLDYKQYRVLPRVVHFEPKQKAEKSYQVCNLFVTLFLIVYILLRVK